MRIHILAAALAAVSLASADTLTLRDGRTVQGQFLGGNTRQVRMAVGDNVQTFDVGEVSSLQFEGSKPASPAPAAAPAPASTPAPAATSSDIQRVMQTAQAQPASAPAAEPGSQLPAGTNITIRMIDSVDSKQSKPGQTFKATVDDPVMLGDRTAIPHGADVTTRLVEVKDPNKITGGGLLTLVLASINVNGKPVEVNSESVTTTGESRKGDSAKVIGGVAALGAIIGAVAGGGKGAAIGAVSGAGAGTAVRVMTKGSEVTIPSETRLTFSLQSPVRL